MSWHLARRASRLNPSIIREILKLTEQPGVISLAGGLPAADAFPVEALRDATARVLRDTPREALQYAASEGYAPLREWVAADLSARGMVVDASQVLITTGSQQGLDLVGKLLIDPGSRVLVESPTYLGALQAFAPYEPAFVPLAGDDEGPLPNALVAGAGAGDERARFVYLLPNFQNPSGRCMSEPRRAALVEHALQAQLPIVEDNPYGELWYDAPPPPPLAARAGAQAIYLGSFSKVLAPGLRLGYVVAPRALYPKLLQAKQASDLHTPGFNQRVVHQVLQDGLLARHVPGLRARYREQRDAMQAALERHWRGPGLEHLAPGRSQDTCAPPQGADTVLRGRGPTDNGCRWQVPSGGMFFWIELPAALDTLALLPRAVQAGVAYVPGAAFYCSAPRANTLRLSFVTVPVAQIEAGVAALAGVLRDAMASSAACARPRDATLAASATP